MSREYFSRMMIGLGLIAAGVLFMLHQSGVLHLDIGYIFSTWWPAILIAISLNGLLFSRRTGSMTWNLILLAVGLYFLGRNLDIWQFGIGDMLPYVVPMILIIAGVGMILRPGRNKDKAYGTDPAPHFADPSHPHHAHADVHGPEFQHGSCNEWGKERKRPHKQEQHSLFGDLHIGASAWTLEPINTSRLVGDTVIDLTTADIPAGETRLNLSALIGDITVRVPDDPDLEVAVDSSSIVGGVTIFDRQESGLFKSIHVQPPHYHQALKRIRIQSSTIIGDLRLHRVPAGGSFPPNA